MPCSPVASAKRPGGAFGGSGFTILELLVAISIVGLVLAVSVPASGRLYKTMQYREAVRDVITLFASARYKAVSTGRAQDVRVNPRTRELSLNDNVKVLPSAINIVVHSARELNDSNVGVIRFYPEGGSSGGGVDLEIPERWGVRINVDWLVGRVSQEKYALD
jgi:general secretion pathway protein H